MGDDNNQRTFLERWAARYLLALAALITLIKLIFAQRLDLYSDEVFYWLESTRPALAYSDLPFVPAQLAGIGPALVGNNALAVRLPFLLLGTALPVLLYFLAKPIQGAEQARQAALLSLCLPLASSLGLLAVPDVPLIALGLLSVTLYLRAQENDHWGLWLATGATVALGLCTHYRFGLFPLGVAINLMAHAPARSVLKNPKAWLSAAIACLGFVPIALFNLNNEMASAAFYFQDRHPWTFNPLGLLHLPLQALITTPILYCVLWIPLLSAGMRRQIAAHTEATQFSEPLRSIAQQLLLTLGLLHLGLYAALAPWSDATSTTEHWPLAGYFMLLPLAPRMIAVLAKKRRVLAALPQWTLALGLVGTTSALLGVGSQSLQSQLQPFVGLNTLSTKMAGWPEFSSFTQALADKEFDSPPLIATDNYYTAAQLGFAEPASLDRLFTLDKSKAVRDGRAAQLRLWEIDADALSARRSSSVLFITEDSTLNVDQKAAVLLSACALAESLGVITQQDFLGGAKRFTFYRLTVGEPKIDCPLPGQGWVDSVQLENSGVVRVDGWAFASHSGIADISAVVDGKMLETELERVAREDVAAVSGATNDPLFPQVGYTLTISGSGLEAGNHSIELVMTNSAGEQSRSQPFSFSVEQ